MSELIPHIKAAIAECEKREDDMAAEMMNIMPQIRKSHYISASTVHLIERQYNEKISNVCQEIADMEAHVKELEAQK